MHIYAAAERHACDPLRNLLGIARLCPIQDGEVARQARRGRLPLEARRAADHVHSGEDFVTTSTRENAKYVQFGRITHTRLLLNKGRRTDQPALHRLDYMRQGRLDAAKAHGKPLHYALT